MIRKSAISVFLFLLPILASAQLEGQFKFIGQNAESVKMEKLVTVLRPVPREVPSTCTRQVPEQQYVCRDVTRYKEECHRVPAERVCRTEYDQVCHSVTRYRDECHRGPSRQVCEREPDRQVCTDRPDRKVCTNRPDRQECHDKPDVQVCTDRPSREVCSERTGQRVCSTIPGGRDCKTVDGGRECRTVDGGQECHLEDGGMDCRTVSGGTSCHTVPGEEICRQVSYQDQECEDVPRQACENIPAHNECVDVPYTQNVCGNETVNRTETYACMKTEMKNEPFQKLLKGLVNVQITTNGIVEEFPVALSAQGDQEMSKFALGLKLPVDPKALVILKSKEMHVVAEGEKEIRAEGNVVLEVIENKAPAIAFPSKIALAYINQETQDLDVAFKGKRPLAGEVEVKLVRKEKVLAELKAQFPSALVQLAKIDGKEGLRLHLAGKFSERLRSGIKMELKLAAPALQVQGEILNSKKPEEAKVYSKVKVDIQ